MALYDQNNQPAPTSRKIDSDIRVSTIPDIEVGSMIDITTILGRPAKGIYVDPSPESEVLIVLNSLEQVRSRENIDVVSWVLLPNQGAQIHVDETWVSNSLFPGLMIDSLSYIDDITPDARITIVVY